MSEKCTTCDIDDMRVNPRVRSISGRWIDGATRMSICNDCGRTWLAKDRYVWWPVGLRWVRHVTSARAPFWGWHGFQIGWHDIDARLMGQVFHVGRLRIVFGRVVVKEVQA